jgi:hypothetical protein
LIAPEEITGLILAGGRGSRMGGVDKGLQNLNGMPMALHTLLRLQMQTGQVMINANRNLAAYESFGVPVWPDVLADEALTFGRLFDVNLREQDLFLLQPDLQAWIRAERAGLADCPRMRLWEAHPIRDFKADLADLISMGWPPDCLTRMGVTYADLQALGVTAETMGLFNYTLLMWAMLGFQRAHAEQIPANTLFRLFKMSKQDVLASLR